MCYINLDSNLTLWVQLKMVCLCLRKDELWLYSCLDLFQMGFFFEAFSFYDLKYLNCNTLDGIINYKNVQNSKVHTFVVLQTCPNFFYRANDKHDELRTMFQEHVM